MSVWTDGQCVPGAVDIVTSLTRSVSFLPMLGEGIFYRFSAPGGGFFAP